MILSFLHPAHLQNKYLWMMLPHSVDSMRYRFNLVFLEGNCNRLWELAKLNWRKHCPRQFCPIRVFWRISLFRLPPWKWKLIKWLCVATPLSMVSSYSEGTIPIVLGQSAPFSLNISNSVTIMPTKSTLSTTLTMFVIFLHTSFTYLWSPLPSLFSALFSSQLPSLLINPIKGREKQPHHSLDIMLSWPNFLY